MVLEPTDRHGLIVERMELACDVITLQASIDPTQLYFRDLFPGFDAGQPIPISMRYVKTSED